MKLAKLFISLITLSMFLACGTATEQKKDAKTEMKTDEKTEKVEMSVVKRPESIVAKMKERGDQDKAEPELLVESPKDGETISSSTVKVKVAVKGDVKMGKDDKGTGNHVHVILDNQPYAAHYMWDEGFELRNVSDGEHTLRMFASRPWHESYKNEKAFKTVKFTVKNGKADETKPTTDDKGKKLADAKKAEGADVKESEAGSVDFTKPLLTYSRPKGKYEGDAAKSIMIDFWLANAKLVGDGGDHKVRYTINSEDPELIEKWEPIWLNGWREGAYTIKLELVDKDGKLVENGGYNLTSRSIDIAP